MQNTQGQTIDTVFFGDKNAITLFQNCAKTLEGQYGALNEKQQNRLGKALEHYMQEVWDVNGPMPLQNLNQEVIRATLGDFNSYFRRNAGSMTTATSQKIVGDTQNQRISEFATQRLAIDTNMPIQPRPTFESNLIMDVGSRFEQLQQERVPASAPKPQVPDFQLTLSKNAEEPSALSLFEAAKRVREEEALRAKPAPAVNTTSTATVNTDLIQQSTLTIPTPTIGSSSGAETNLLAKYMASPAVANDPNQNPTLALPTASPAPRGPLPQDFIIKQDDIITYKETEHNLVIYSADRDWLHNTKENRYNFSVNFDVGNLLQNKFHFSPSSTKKFRNISRIELVKVIMPTEGIDNLVLYNEGEFTTSTRLNVLSYPYIVVRIPELDGNNYGTDNTIDNAFGIIHYDANWISDTQNLTDGFLSLIPKFLKCQKVYQPTPLATLTKLTIELQRPDGNPISKMMDSVGIKAIYDCTTIPGGVYTGTYAGVTDGSSPSGAYFIIQTSTFFSQWAFTEGNRLQIKGLNPQDISNYSTVESAANDFVNYLQQEAGLLLIGIGNSTTQTDGPNTVGYGDLLIVRTAFQDPTTGSVAIQPFGGQVDNTALATELVTTTFAGAKLINLTHQVNVVFRIITRELDSTARVRPDNL